MSKKWMVDQQTGKPYVLYSDKRHPGKVNRRFGTLQKCAVCEKKCFVLTVPRLVGKLRCCSQVCRIKALNSLSRFKLQRKINKYVYILAPNHPHTTSGGYVTEHRLIVERALGRLLTYDEKVHHINLDKLDNRNSNLLVCSGSYHHLIHYRMQQKYAEVFLGGPHV